MKYIIETAAERRARRKNDIKTLFQKLTIEEGVPFMEAYEAVGFVFYEQADAIRKILASMNRSGKISHNHSNKKR